MSVEESKELLGTCYLGWKGGQTEWKEQKVSQFSAPIFIFIMRREMELSEKMRQEWRRKQSCQLE